MQRATVNQEANSTQLHLQTQRSGTRGVVHIQVRVYISDYLDIKDHIDWTVKKANSILGFMRRTLNINSSEAKSSAYITLVHPQLNYCASICSPHTDQSKKKLEMVQRRSARYCTNTCADPDGGRAQGVRTSLKNHKNKGFHSNTAPDPLKNHKTTTPSFNAGSLSARQRNVI